jgi:predicted enzyme related to lactoylglutathione lyase
LTDVEGIGGVFIASEDADRLAKWYETVLGIEMTAHPNGIGYFHVFQTRDLAGGFIRENPVFAINHAETPLAKTGRGFTLNLRVQALDPLLEKLRSQGVPVEERMIIWEGGKHAWIQDPDGNRIELYEEILMG